MLSSDRRSSTVTSRKSIRWDQLKLILINTYLFNWNKFYNISQRWQYKEEKNSNLLCSVGPNQQILTVSKQNMRHFFYIRQIRSASRWFTLCTDCQSSLNHACPSSSVSPPRDYIFPCLSQTNTIRLEIISFTLIILTIYNNTNEIMNFSNNSKFLRILCISGSPPTLWRLTPKRF
jgi:hypothetical protein